MLWYWSLRAAVIFMGFMVPAQALALEFVTVGPRAMGMGGAGVAVTTDSLATYWNPAGLAQLQVQEAGFMQNEYLEGISEQYARPEFARRF